MVEKLKKLPYLRDVQVGQSITLPGDEHQY
jgi:hypothetical protein